MKENTPIVMGIININRESFYASSRHTSPEDVACHYEKMLYDGAKMIDIGACSTRPGSTPVDIGTRMGLSERTAQRAGYQT